MENKKTFGEYICRRRLELGLTQREFAQRLFVTESAVSKWERGLSYPDITLLRDICAVLDISEHELLTASEDTEARRAELLAKKYLTLTRNFRLGQYIFYGIVLLIGLVINLSMDRRVDWFFIYLSAAGMCASLTLVPALVEQHRAAAVIGAWTACLELTLLTACLYSGGDWFWVAGVGTLFGLSLFLLPPVLRSLPLPPLWQERKTLLYFAVETALLLLLLAVSAWYSRGNWFLLAADGCLFGITLVLLPFLMKQLPLPDLWQNRKSLLYFIIETALLLVLLAVSAWYSGGDWFPVAAVGCLFGITLVFLPFLMKQIPLPPLWQSRKALLYFAVETALLLVLEFVCSLYSETFWFFLPGLPLTLYLLLLPWTVMLLIRYAPIGGWFKASGCCGLLALYHATLAAAVDRILWLSGTATDLPLATVGFQPDWGDWADPAAIANNVNALLSLGLILLTILYAFIGILRRRKSPPAAPSEP